VPRYSALSPLPVARRVAAWLQRFHSLARPDWPEHVVVGGATEMPQLRRSRARSMVKSARAAGSSSGARRDTAGAEEPHGRRRATRVIGLFLDKMEVEEDDRMRKTVTKSLTAWPHRPEKEGYSRHRH